MIEVLHSLYLVKGYLRMTLDTILTKFIIMDILVTVGAFPEGKTGELLHLFPILIGFFMTKYALSLGMFAFQRESGSPMIKSRCWIKCIEIMTGRTI